MTTTLNLTIDPRTKRALDALARANGRTMSAEARLAIANHLAANAPAKATHRRKAGAK